MKKLFIAVFVAVFALAWTGTAALSQTIELQGVVPEDGDHLIMEDGQTFLVAGWFGLAGEPPLPKSFLKQGMYPMLMPSFTACANSGVGLAEYLGHIYPSGDPGMWWFVACIKVADESDAIDWVLLQTFPTYFPEFVDLFYGTPS